jgi:hypothetical protein
MTPTRSHPIAPLSDLKLGTSSTYPNLHVANAFDLSDDREELSKPTGPSYGHLFVRTPRQAPVHFIQPRGLISLPRGESNLRPGCFRVHSFSLLSLGRTRSRPGRSNPMPRLERRVRRSPATLHPAAQFRFLSEGGKQPPRSGCFRVVVPFSPKFAGDSGAVAL